MPAIEELLSRGIKLLVSKNISSPALDAALLLAEAAEQSREQLYAHPEAELGKEQEDRYAEFLERRQNGECIAHILGRKEFWGLDFTVSPEVLVPRPDTEILVEAALDILRRRAEKSPPGGFSVPVLDLCTGSGAVAIALKHECPRLEVWAVDISEAALALARANAAKLLPKKPSVVFLAGDLFEAGIHSKTRGIHSKTRPPRFALITANAPYIPSAAIAELSPEVRHEPLLALDGGQDGLSLIRRIIAEAPLYLEAGGTLALEADPSQMETISALMKERGFSCPVRCRDLSGRDRVITGVFP
ncbi:release factor glutamine methyltransferase [Spirochaetia bacterium]|nr:release factor glutamine methyltransferase [Spirochaetia bacterium]